MKRINVLDKEIFNRISAGEVVENPTSVVKELVENSIDAGATSISIEIEKGGIKKIAVSDNGGGIHFDDLSNAFLPHSTSKISSIDDLDSIKTLGFRGEALASIAAVSKVKLLSKQKDAEVGGCINISNENIEISEAGCMDGTYITVSDLFYNTPARAKFLKSQSREESLVTNLVARLILANYNISFKYIIDGVLKYSSQGKGKEDAIYTVYNKAGLKESFYFEKDFDDIKISAYLGKPNFAKANRTYQTIIVNGRYVENSTISSSINNGYEDFLMKRKFPFFVLYMDFPYDRIDVNVHPRKMEIKFDDNQFIYVMILRFVKEALNSMHRIEQASIQDNIISTFKKNNENATQIAEKIQEIPIKSEKISTLNTTNPVKIEREEVKKVNVPPQEIKQKTFVYSKPEEKEIKIQEKPVYTEKKPIIENITVSSNVDKSSFIKETPKLEEILAPKKEEVIQQSIFEPKSVKEEEKQEITFNDLKLKGKFVGTIFNTYLIYELQDEMILIDQHAAHERLLYDKIVDSLKNKTLYSQTLLTPYSFSVNNIEKEFIKDNLDNFKEIGFNIQEFGSDLFKVYEVPSLLCDININDFITNILSDIYSLKKLNVKDIINNKLCQMACKAAVKGGNQLSMEEIDTLIAMVQNDTTLLCPHGRPIVVKIDKKSLEKWFKRIV